MSTNLLKLLKRLNAVLPFRLILILFALYPLGSNIFAADYFINYQKTAGKDTDGWLESYKIPMSAGETASFYVKLTKGTHFGIKEGNNFYGPTAGESDLNVDSAYKYTDSLGDNKHFVWNGNDGGVKITVTLGADGKPCAVEFAEQPFVALYCAHYNSVSDGKWVDGPRIPYNNEGSITLEYPEMDYDNHFGFKIENVFYGPISYTGVAGGESDTNGFGITDHYIWQGEKSPVKMTLTFNSDGEPIKADFEGAPRTIRDTFFLNYQRVANDNNTWENSENKIEIRGAGTYSFTVNLTHGAHFGLKNSGGTFFGPQLKDTYLMPGVGYYETFGLNNKHFIWYGGDGEATITFNVDETGVPTIINVTGQVQQNFTYFVNHQCSEDTSAGWANSTKVTAHPSETVEIPVDLSNGFRFGVKDELNTFFGPNGADMQVEPGDECPAPFSLNDKHFIWKGSRSDATRVLLTLDEFGWPAKIAFAGEKMGTYLYGRWVYDEPAEHTANSPSSKVSAPGVKRSPVQADESIELLADLTDGKPFYITASDKNRTLYYYVSINGVHYGQPGSDFNETQDITAAENLLNGWTTAAYMQPSSAMYMVEIPAYKKAVVKYQADFEFKKDCVNYPYTENSTAPAIWFESYMDAQPASLGMPFYPQGIYNEEQFQEAIELNRPYYYLLAHDINNEQPSPEWELVLQTSGKNQGKYTCDFTFSDHALVYSEKTGTYASCGNSNRPNIFSVYGFSNASEVEGKIVLDNKNIKDDITPPSATGDNKIIAGLRVRAIYDEANGGSLTFVPLEYIQGEWVETDTPDILPFISFVGSQWSQPASTPTTLIGNIPTDYNNYLKYTGNPAYKWDHTTENWQNSWIQYDARGNAVTSRDKSVVYFNTQWPPLHPIMLSYTLIFGEEENKTEYPMTLNSGDLTFHATGLEGPVSELEKMYPGADFKYPGDNYVVYEVDDFWAVGAFKLWTGWNGARTNNTDVGAEWLCNWNWGHTSHNVGSTAELVKGGTTYLGIEGGDMAFAEPTYLNKVYLFVSKEHPHEGDAANDEMHHSFIYTQEALGGSSIHALSNSERTGGMFFPSVTNIPADSRVSFIGVDLYKVGNDASIANLWTSPVDEGEINVDNFNASFHKRFNNTDAPQNYWNDGYLYKEVGYYYYTMTLIFSDVQGVDHKITVKSNPFYVDSASTSLYSAQLVKPLNTGSDKYAGYDYITYAQGMTMGYAVKSSESSIQISEIEAPDNDFYSDSEQAMWTDEILLIAPKPDLGEAPARDMQWLLGETVLSADPKHDLILIEKAARLGNQAFTVNYKYSLVDESGTTEMNRSASADVNMLLPTPCLGNDFSISIEQAETGAEVDIDGDDVFGDLPTEHYPSGKLQHYSGVDAHRLDIEIPILMPNATPGLLALAGENKEFTLSFESNGHIQNLIGSQSFQFASADGDANLIFGSQDLRDWIENESELTPGSSSYSGKENAIALRVAPDKDIPFFDRTEGTLKVTLDPVANAPEITGYQLYRLKAQINPDKNLFEERLMMRHVQSSHKPSHVSERKKASLSVNNDDTALYALALDGQPIGYRENENYDASHLFNYGEIKSENTEHVICTSPSFTWWAGMYNIDLIDAQKLHLSPAFIFYVDKTCTLQKIDKEEAPANAPQRSGADRDLKAVAFVPMFSAISLSDILTQVEAIDTPEAHIIAGEGFIDLLGNQACISNLSGICLYEGNDRVELPAGIYIVKTASGATKVMVR